MKKCFKCNEWKSREEFYAHPSMSDGLLGKCKGCAKTDVQDNYRNKRQYYSEYERSRQQDSSRRAKKVNYQRTHRSKSPEKVQARRKTAYAVRAGILVKQPCKFCGDSRVQAHHHDYGKPLDVTWMCFKCHREHGHNQVVTASLPEIANR
jgi:ribosomal protein S27AE